MAAKRRGTAAPKPAAKKASKKAPARGRQGNRNGTSARAPEPAITATDVLQGSSRPLIRAAFAKRLRQGS